jgi:hypothetical protein
MGERDFIALIDGAYQLLKAPIVLVWDRCAVRRFVVSPTHSGGIWRDIPGPPDLPGGEAEGDSSMSGKRRPTGGV